MLQTQELFTFLAQTLCFLSFERGQMAQRPKVLDVSSLVLLLEM
jgi:hypothetical protein